MSDFMQEHVKEHEVAKGFVRPANDTPHSVVRLLNCCTGARQRVPLCLCKPSRHVPRGNRLLIQHNSPRNVQPSEQSAARRCRRRGLSKLNFAQAVKAALPKEQEKLLDIRSACWMVVALPGLAHSDTGKLRFWRLWSRRAFIRKPQFLQPSPNAP